MPGGPFPRRPGAGLRIEPSTGAGAGANILSTPPPLSAATGGPALSTPSPLDAPATRSLIEALHREGLLDEAARGEALETLARETDWWRPLSLLLGALGTALMLSGVIYFFAANWSGFSRFEKLGLAAVLPALALGLALGKGIDGQLGRLALLSATVLTGAFLAVFGQVYQTGADAWQLFATWVVLTLPWMLVSRFLGHVATWLVVLHVAIATLWLQDLHPGARVFPSGLCLTLALVSLGAIALLGWLDEKGEHWTASPWARRLLLGSALASLTLPACMYVVAWDETSAITPLVAILALAAIGCSWWWHRARQPDLAALALTALAAAAIALTAIGKPLFELSDEWPMFILFGFIVSATIGGLTVLLRREQQAIRRRP
jgi:uncharacterized membrane protein